MNSTTAIFQHRSLAFLCDLLVDLLSYSSFWYGGYSLGISTIHSAFVQISLLNYFNNRLLPIVIVVVGLLFIIQMLEMYSRYFDPVIRKLYPSTSSIPESIKIIHYKTLSIAYRVGLLSQ